MRIEANYARPTEASKHSLVVVGFVQRPLQVQALTRGDAHVNLHREEGFCEVLLRRMPPNTVYGRKHLAQEGTGNGATKGRVYLCKRNPMNDAMA